MLLEEVQLINYWLASKDKNFLAKNHIDQSFFFVLKDTVLWIEAFVRRTGKLPSSETVASEFEDYDTETDLEPLDYLISVVTERKAYTEYRPILVTNAKLVNKGNTVEAMWKMRQDIDKLLKTYTTKMVKYDWVKDAKTRYDAYMKNHGREGIIGIPTGHSELDKLTGGWLEDDFILLSARLGEGKSLNGTHFAYHAWRYIQKSKINAPVVYITTEMPELEIAYRLDTIKSHLSNTELRNGKLQNVEDYKDFLNELSKKESSFLILSQESNGGREFTPNDILSVIESEKPAFLVIDQLYDIQDSSGERDIRKRIVNVTRDVRDINLRTRTPTIMIAQAGRESAKNAKKDPNASPEVHEIQESDAPAQKATRVITLRMIPGESGYDQFKMSLKKNRGGVKEKDVFWRVRIDTGIWEEDTVETSNF